MKFSLAVFIALAPLALLSPAQQPSDSTNMHTADAATFGNKKPPKKDKAPVSRTVTGQVTDASGQVLEGAMVTLTDKKTNERTSFFTKKDGRYKFEDLAFTNDYEVQARYKTFASELKKLSQYDTTPRPVRILEIDTSSPTPAESAAKQ